MRKIAGKILAGFACLLLFCTAVLPVQAADSLTVTEKYTTEQGLVLYVKGMENTIDTAAYQVGTTECTVDGISLVGEAEETIRTLILWDNSQSVMKKCGDEVKDILIDVVANRAAGEQFAIATIDEEVVYQTDYTGDYASLKQVIEGIESEDKDAYIIENLYEAILSFNAMEDCGYKRIILISDGMDATEIGYSKAELDTLISGTSYPIYTIGVLSKDRQDELQEMFAFSRTTAAEYFYLDEIEDTMTVVQGLSADYNMLQVKVSVPSEIQDGSTQNSKLTFTSGSETYTATSQVVLPFAKQEETGETEAAETEATETESSTEEAGEAVGDEDADTEEGSGTITLFGKELPLMLVICIGAGVLAVILIIVIIILVCTGKKKKAPEGNDYARLDQQIKNERHVAAGGQPAMQGNNAGSAVNPVGGPAGGGNKTQLLFGNGPAPAAGNGPMQPVQGAHRIILVNTLDAVKTYQCNMADKTIVGRNPATSNLTIADNAVSERHCEVGITGGKFYIKDLGSSNGTFINGCRINANVMTEIKTGCILKLGRNEYRVTVE